MRKRITFSVDEVLIQQARWIAANENTTLNQLLHTWLTRYIAQANAPEQFDELMKHFAHIQAGDSISREEMNERR